MSVESSNSSISYSVASSPQSSDSTNFTLSASVTVLPTNSTLCVSLSATVVTGYTVFSTYSIACSATTPATTLVIAYDSSSPFRRMHSTKLPTVPKVVVITTVSLSTSTAGSTRHCLPRTKPKASPSTNMRPFTVMAFSSSTTTKRGVIADTCATRTSNAGNATMFSPANW